MIWCWVRSILIILSNAVLSQLLHDSVKIVDIREPMTRPIVPDLSLVMDPIPDDTVVLAPRG